MDLIILSIPIFFLLLIVEIAWDYFAHKKSQNVYRVNDAVTNISCGILDQVSGIFAKVFTIGAYVFVFNWASSVTGINLQNSWFNFILCFIAADFAYYWAHRLSHKVNFLWAGHIIHHQSEEYNLSVALRQGAFQKLLTFWVYLPLALVGFKPEWFIISIAINLLYQFWIHTELVKQMGVLEYVLNTPSHHRVHHGRNPKYIDKNHAGVLIIWDKMLGTFQKEEEHPTYGITNPSNTFNAVEAHFQPFFRIWQDLKIISGIKNKMLYLLKPPGWYPKELGGFKPAPEIEHPPRKYEVIIPIQAHYYVIVQFLIAISISSWILFNIPLYSNYYKVFFLIFISYYLYSTGLILTANNKAKVFEIVKLFGIILVAFLISTTVGYISIPIAILSGIWFLKLNIQTK